MRAVLAMAACMVAMGAATGMAQEAAQPSEPAPAPAPNPEEGLIAVPTEAAPADGAGADAAAPAESAPPAEPAAAEVEVELGDADPAGGLWLIGGKLGGLASFNGLNPFLHFGVELGYVFPTLDHGLGAALQVEYSVPRADGSVEEDFDPERVPTGGYDWELVQKELVLSPLFLYRMTFLSGSLTPYAGLGLRIYLLESTVTGKAGDQTIDETAERSTKWGFGLPVGAELALGPGSLTGELMFQWGPFDHTLTGDTHLGGLSLLVGYRLLL